jgi:hypothetical protein
LFVIDHRSKTDRKNITHKAASFNLALLQPMGSSFMQAFYLNYFRFLTVSILILICMRISGQPFSFRKINSGTKSDIFAIKKDKYQGVYFLTDKIHVLDNDKWKTLDFPAEGKIFTFYPISAQDIWFTITQVRSTSRARLITP